MQLISQCLAPGLSSCSAIDLPDVACCEIGFLNCMTGPCQVKQIIVYHETQVRNGGNTTILAMPSITRLMPGSVDKMTTRPCHVATNFVVAMFLALVCG
jgi:hypothetical protein